MDYERRAQRHLEFWERKNKEHLIGFSAGDYFISKRFAAAAGLLRANREVRPEDVCPESFLPDYEMMYEAALREGGDLFYTPEPMPGIPWLEAMSGFPIHSSASSFYSGKGQTEEAGKIVCPAWHEKYMDFLLMLSGAGNGKYVGGQPILRGPADLLGTGAGQERLIYDMVDEPEDVKQKLRGFADLMIQVVSESPAGAGRGNTIYGGHAMGFYHLWCPGDCLWFQDDLTALLSPGLYKEILLDIHTKLAGGAAFTMMHLHMASAYVIDFLLDMGALNAIQLNKDNGESVEAMLPLLKKVREVKNLVLWGDFSPADIELLRQGLDPQGVYIIVFGANWAA